MTEIKYYELGELADVTKLAGFEFTKYIKYNNYGEIIALRASNLRRGELNLTDIKRIDRSVSELLPRSKLYVNDILLTYTGNGYGDCAIIEENDKYHLAPNICKIAPNIEKVVPYYLYSYIRTNEFYKIMSSHMSGSSQPTIPMKTIRVLPIPLPPMGVQKKVAEVAYCINEKIRKNNIINKNLLEQALAIYKDWFCDYALSDGILPENWKITTIDAISSLVTRGIAPKYNDSSDQIVLNQKCIRDHTIDISLSRRHLPKKINEKWISKGDLLINSTGTGTLGRVAQVWFEANNMTVDSHVTIVRPKDSILQSYIGFWGLSHESEIEAQHTGSTGQTELPRDRVKAMELPLPDKDTLSKFNELVIPMTSTVISNQEENARLSQLRDALLPKLMSGELDVSDIDL